MVTSTHVSSWVAAPGSAHPVHGLRGIVDQVDEDLIDFRFVGAQECGRRQIGSRCRRRQNKASPSHLDGFQETFCYIDVGFARPRRTGVSGKIPNDVGHVAA